MGGAAFAQASAPGYPMLKTPRMSPEVYNKLKAAYLTKLQACLPDGRVTCLIEAPEKKDYGDIDLLVGLDRQVDQLDLANALGAVGLIARSQGNHQSLTLGVLMDGTASLFQTVVYHQLHTKNGAQVDVRTLPRPVTQHDHAQIDITVIAPDMMEWHLFYSSYGDMLGLLGHIVNNLGFTITDVGFWLRLQELDDSKQVENSGIADKDGYVFLTRDPKELMRFMGVSVEKYEAGFTTLEQLYEWLFECRMLYASTLRIKRNTAKTRQREQKRYIYSQFFYEWLPAHMDLTTDGEEIEPRKTNRDIRESMKFDAIQVFSKMPEFDTVHLTITRQLGNAIARNLLRPIVARHSQLSPKLVKDIMRGFNRFVGVDQAGRPYALPAGQKDAEAQLFRLLTKDRESFKDPDAVDDFVKGDWEELQELVRLSKT